MSCLGDRNGYLCRFSHSERFSAAEVASSSPPHLALRTLHLHSSVAGLKKAVDLNGQSGEILSFVASSGRFRVLTAPGFINAFLPGNLQLLRAAPYGSE